MTTRLHLPVRLRRLALAIRGFAMRAVAMRAVAIASIAGFPSLARAQSATAMYGITSTAYGDREESARTMGLRVDDVLGRWWVAEAGLQYTPMKAWQANDSYATPRYAAGASIQLQLPFEAVRPYAGFGFGAFTHRRLPRPDGTRGRLVGSYRAFPVGLRADLSSRLTSRVEARIRMDRPSFGYYAFDAEVALGVGVRW